MPALIIIRRGATERFRLLQDVFAREPVEILWDRRVRQRRQPRAPTAVERRGRQRREAGGETRAEPPGELRKEPRASERRQRDEPSMPERRRRDRRGPVPTSWTALDCLVANARDPRSGVFKRRTEAVGQLLPTLYLHGLAEGDFDLALRGLLGDGAPLSASSIARLKASWQAEYHEWNTRSLADLEPVYLWVDGVYVKAGLEKDKAAMLVVLAGLRDGRKVILAVESGYRESTESWAALLRDRKARGLRPPRLVVGDGHLGIWGALTAVFPLARQQRCWNHRLLNVLDKVPKRLQAEARRLLTAIPYADTREDAERQKRAFQAWCTKRGVSLAGQALDQDWERFVTFYEFPKAHWKHLRTSNPIESPFAAVRLRTAAAKRYKKVENATAVIWKTLLIAEHTFRRLDAPELLAEVAEGVVYINGVRQRAEAKHAAA